jgi:hypothetical protein
MENTNICAGNDVEKIIRTNSIPVRFAVYDNRGELLGYKANNAWNLESEYFNIHCFSGTREIRDSLNNFVNTLNNSGHWHICGERISSISELYVVIEEIDESEHFVDGLAGYYIRRKSEGKKFESIK